MSELESSGLLDRESDQPDPQLSTDGPAISTTHATARPSATTAQPAGSEQASNAAAEPNLAATIVNAVTDDQLEAPMQKTEANGLPEQQPGNASDAAGAADSSEAAEQRVLGDLEGAPTWREVLVLSRRSVATA